MRDGLRLEKASETGLGKNALILELGKSCKMDRRYPKLNTQWKACFEKLWKFPCLSYYKNKKIKPTHYAEVWKQGHKVRMLQDRRTTFQRKLPWMYYQCTSKAWRRTVKNLSLAAGVNSSFWGLVSDTFVHVAGSESVDRLFHSLLLNVEYTTISKVHFLGIKKDTTAKLQLFPQMMHLFWILCKMYSQEKRAFFWPFRKI